MGTFTKATFAAVGICLFSAALAATVTQVGRRSTAVPGTFVYTYAYVCANAKKNGTFTVTASNEKTARQQANNDTKATCGES